MSLTRKDEGANVSFETEFAGKKLIIKTGTLAQQAHGSCTVQLGDTVVLATVVMESEPREGVDFFPLMVDLEERLYAAGKIKGSRWIKREGRPADEAILTARLIDRSIRPLFPDYMKNDVQVIITVLSVDGENDSDIVGLIAASTVLALSPVPWNGPIGGIRLGRIPSEADPAQAEWVVNPTFAAREKSMLDLIVAGKPNKVLMIEAGANELGEEVMMEGIEFAQKHIGTIVDIINDVVGQIGKKKWDMSEVPTDVSETPESHKELVKMTNQWLDENVEAVLFDKTLTTKGSRKAAVGQLKQSLMKFLEENSVGKDRRKKAEPIFDEYIEKSITEHILKKEQRVDGRSLLQIRPLSSQVGLLPRTHGSGLFSRGETQVLSVVTLGAPGDEQMLEGIETNGKKRYMHHYNFPSYSVGETGPIRSPGRREIGHGALAEKALIPVLPSKEEFPYTIRVVSEVLSSNGSSSMGSVCGSTLSLMDAGVPLKRPVAGIAMGLASDEKGNYKVLTDLQDLEDGTGGMDFKIAGTSVGITAIQLDTKTTGLSMEVCRQTLSQAKAARMEILDVMAGAIPQVRTELSPYAPRILTIKIDPSKIREVIGAGGKVINEIIDKTGVQMDIDQTGIVFITSVNAEGAKKAEEMVNNIVREVQVGEVFEGKVTRIMDFGAIVEFLPGKDGMVHISELAPHRVATVEDVVKLGDSVKVKVLKVEDGKIGLSIKALLPGAVDSPRGFDDRGGRPRRGGFDRGGRGGGYKKF